jgi:hypothetical protein
MLREVRHKSWLPGLIRHRGGQTLYEAYRSHVLTGATGWEMTELLPFGGQSHV